MEAEAEEAEEDDLFVGCTGWMSIALHSENVYAGHAMRLGTYEFNETFDSCTVRDVALKGAGRCCGWFARRASPLFL